MDLGLGKNTIKKLGAHVILVLSIMVYASSGFGQSIDSLQIHLNQELKGVNSSHWYFGSYNYQNRKRIAVDSVFFVENEKTLVIEFNKALAEMPFRVGDAERIVDSVKVRLPEEYSSYHIKLLANGVELNHLIPNYFQEPEGVQKKRLSSGGVRKRQNLVQPKRYYEINAGLLHSNIALWNSHGWYYEPKLNRWEWQRARLFTTIEDLLPTAFVTQFIAPMLENAGANVFIPRERDWQTNEIIVDNNGSNGKSKFLRPKKRSAEPKGFGIGRLPYRNENPFRLGTSVAFQSYKKENGASYIPDIPETGNYSVYVSYGKGDGEVTYRVHHSGGVNDCVVNQQMGYGTWVYLGNFNFLKGLDKKHSKVELIVPTGAKQTFSADAVRFGGGMGVVEREGKLGGRAKFFEGARYYLQFSGAPDTLVWKLNENDDYKDDYMSRGEWVNWLQGTAAGEQGKFANSGLGVPIDLAFAFHTDAGILPDDKIVGTLGIYSTDRDTNVFENGQSKYASRDLCDLIQSQIVDDINAIYKTDWTRRGMWNAQYSEAYRPQVPTMLLELLSHQNLNDAVYMLHPKYRFDVSRAIYKAMLRFIATQNGYDYVVQPLPVNQLQTEFVGSNSVELKWTPVNDNLEPSAVAQKYMVYKREGELGFDNGTLIDKPEIIIDNLSTNKVYGFKVTAINAGGESFPSEIISVGLAENSKGKVLIVNGFDRIDGPAVFESDSLAGIVRNLDNGIAYGYDISTTGNQYDFNRKSLWLDDDSPGHGASYGDLETTIFKGNTFDFSFEHGESILNAGYSFVSCSDESFESGRVKLGDYDVIDLLYGEEKTSYWPGKDKTPHYTIYNENMLATLENYTAQGGNILISGAYVGSEIPKNKQDIKRIGELLKFKWRTNHAAKGGAFYSVHPGLNFSGAFNTTYNTAQYPVEAPDGIEPFGDEAQTIFRYAENNVSAAVLYKGKYNVLALGFPFESVVNKEQRHALMQTLLNKLID